MMRDCGQSGRLVMQTIAVNDARLRAVRQVGDAKRLKGST